MLAFITCLRHPATCDYAAVCRNFERTLRSICRQTVDDFSVIVVCNEIPTIEFSHPNVSYTVVDFPPADQQHLPSPFGQKIGNLDKGLKFAVGVDAARDYSPSHVMLMDADDLVSRRLAEHTANNHHANGWYVDSGYVYCCLSQTIQKKFGLNRYCGTTQIPSLDGYLRACLFPPTLPVKDGFRAVYESLDTNGFHYLLSSHGYLRNGMRAAGAPINALPFPGAVWVINHGQNHLGALKPGRGIRPTPTRLAEFTDELDAFHATDHAAISGRIRAVPGAVASWIGSRSTSPAAFPRQ